MGAKVYVDLDALAKLAHWDLLDALSASTGLSWEDFATVASAKFRCQRSAGKPDGKLFRAEDAAQRALAVVTQMQPLGAPDPEQLRVFQDAPGIDSGEALLLALLLTGTDSLLVTGDKRCVRALGSLPPDIRTRLAGRIVVIEQVILRTLDVQGIDYLRSHIASHLGIDKTISICMGSHCDAAPASVREGLHSYIGEVNAGAPPLLAVVDAQGHFQKRSQAAA